MNRKRELLNVGLLLLFSLLPLQHARAQEWLNKLIPLKTSKNEVKALMSVPARETDLDGDSLTYFMGRWTVIVDFSPDNCISGKYPGIDVGKDIVISSYFIDRSGDYRKFLKISSLENKVKRLKKEKLGEMDYFTDLERGIRYETYSGYVRSISYFIPPKKRAELSCGRNN